MKSNEVLDVRLTAVENDVKDLKKVMETLNRIATEISNLALETKYNREDVNDLVCRVKEIECKPTKRYEAVVMTIITSVISIGIGAVAMYIGLK